MAVRWPDGSFTGSVRVGKEPAPTPVEPEPEETADDVADEVKSDKKEVKDADR